MTRNADHAHRPSRWPAFFRLAWRPALAVMMLLLGGLFTLLPLLDLPDGPLSVLAAWRAGVASPDVLNALWRAVVVLAAALGVDVGQATNAIELTPFAWSLPALHSRLTVGRLSVGIVLVVLVTTVFWPIGTVGDTAAAAMCAFLVFAIADGLCRHVLDGQLGWLIVTVVVLVAVLELWHTGSVIDVVAGGSMITAVLAAATAVAITGRGASRATARRRLTADPDDAGSTVRSWLGLDSDAPLPPRPTNGSLVEWRRVSNYAWGASSKRASFAAMALIPVWGAAWAYTSDDLAMLGLMGAIALGNPSSGARGQLLYPISRHRRAALLFLGNAMQTVAYLLVTAVVLGMLYRWHPWPQILAIDSPSHRHDPVLTIALAFAWLPVAQWWGFQPGRSVEARLAGERAAGIALSYFVLAVMVLPSMLVYDRTLRHLPLPVGVAAIALLAVVVHTTFYLGVHRSYARKDLV